MVAAASLEVTAPPAEQRMLLSNVTWKEYVLLRDVLDGPSIRFAVRDDTPAALREFEREIGTP
jgi:hypothetical protein